MIRLMFASDSSWRCGRWVVLLAAMLVTATATIADEPMTAEDMQASIRQIMGHFYRPDRMFAVGLHILSLPAIVFYFHQIKSGWQNWYRRWRRYLYRTGGWLTLRRWRSLFKKGTFLSKLAEAKQRSQSN